MSNRILIVDDDDDFRSLLSDLYLQADYEVKSVSNPLEALKILRNESFSLCVTDQSMPELKGVDFIEKCREIKPNLPVIMVSAYLSDDLTQRLQAMRIEVFHKPLNIMSLLRKTSELIKLASTPIETKEKPAEVFKEEDSQTPKKEAPKQRSKFRSFALKSDASKRLKKEIESIGITLPNLVLVGDEGTHFRSICEDVQRQVSKEEHEFLYFTNRKLNVFDISKMIEGKPASKSLVLALTEAYDLGVAHKQALLKLYKKTGPFANIENPIKFIFCLHEDLDAQFASGAIDEDFYLILGQKEIYIPRLNLCKEDIPDLAAQTAQNLVSTKTVNTTFGGFDAGAEQNLSNTSWEFNHRSLQNVMASALKIAGGRPITSSILTQAADNPSETGDLSDTLSSQPVPQTASGKISSTTPTKTTPATKTSTLPKADTKPYIPKVKTGTTTPKIQSFPMLENESELARTIFERK